MQYVQRRCNIILSFKNRFRTLATSLARTSVLEVAVRLLTSTEPTAGSRGGKRHSLPDLNYNRPKELPAREVLSEDR